MQKFFNQDPKRVAYFLTGAVLVQGDLVGLLIEATPRDETHCKRFAKRAICRLDDPVEMAVEMYLNRPILFFRTRDGKEVGTCIQIQEIELAGKRYKGTKKVCDALGLTEAQAGTITYDGTVIRLDWSNGGKQTPIRPVRPRQPKR